MTIQKVMPGVFEITTQDEILYMDYAECKRFIECNLNSGYRVIASISMGGIPTIYIN